MGAEAEGISGRQGGFWPIRVARGFIIGRRSSGRVIGARRGKLGLDNVAPFTGSPTEVRQEGVRFWEKNGGPGAIVAREMKKNVLRWARCNG